VFWSEFAEKQPRIFGALLDAVVCALRREPTIELPEKPRMADFAVWIVAAEPALGWPVGSFMAAYMANRRDAATLALESSRFGVAVRDFVQARPDGAWDGTAKELLSAIARPDDIPKREWPASARGVGGKIRRLASALRANGIDVVTDERDSSAKRKRLIHLQYRPIQPSDPAGPSDNCPHDTAKADSARTVADDRGRSDSSATVRTNPPAEDGNADSDGPDDLDGSRATVPPGEESTAAPLRSPAKSFDQQLKTLFGLAGAEVDDVG
jgi:hypothetical protein